MLSQCKPNNIKPEPAGIKIKQKHSTSTSVLKATKEET